MEGLYYLVGQYFINFESFSWVEDHDFLQKLGEFSRDVFEIVRRFGVGRDFDLFDHGFGDF